MNHQFSDPGLPQTHYPIPERETYYPAWGPNFTKHLDMVIVDNDGDAYLKADESPVLVQDILAERRWAIDYETGKLMNERDFRDAYLNWIMNVCAGNEVIPMRSVNPHFEPTLEPIPNVSDFVLHREKGGRLDWGDQHARIFKPQQSIDPSLLGAIVSEAKAAGMREATGMKASYDPPVERPAASPIAGMELDIEPVKE